jgi:ligand-binding SRPBCC domain-containing protein
MKFFNRFTVAAPLNEVVTFHRRPASMAEITPPPLLVQMTTTPSAPLDGSKMAFTLWLGPLPVRWVARLEQITPISFVDRQINGPFARWVHLHTFLPVDSQRTEVVDQVEVELQSHWLWGPVGLAMWLGLPALFAYRAWRTQRLVGEH